MNHKHTDIFANLQAHMVVKGQQLNQRLGRVVDSHLDAETKSSMSKGAKHGAAIGALIAGQMAFAQAPSTTPTLLTNTSTALCTIAVELQGPIGVVLIILMVIAGGISFAVGGKKAMSYMIGAFGGGGVIFAAKSLAGMFIPATTTCKLS